MEIKISHSHSHFFSVDIIEIHVNPGSQGVQILWCGHG